MEKHMKTYRAHRALAFLYAFCAFILFAVIAGAIFTGKADGMPIVGVLMMFAFFAAIFCLHWFVGGAARQKKPWARVTSIIIGIIALLGFPLGTIIGIYLLVNAVPAWSPPQEAVPAAS
jgi:hypothetical protein